MKQIMTGAPAQESSLHPRPAAATVTGLVRPLLTTAGQYDHVAAAAYLMKHAGTTALMVVDTQTGRPAADAGASVESWRCGWQGWLGQDGREISAQALPGGSPWPGRYGT